jgi:predicted amidohydrolase
MSSKLVAACLQITSGPSIEDNLKTIMLLLERAHTHGATLITLPECTDFRTLGQNQRLNTACSEDSHPAIPFFSQAAKKYSAWILVGSLAIRTTSEKLANRSYLFNPDGAIVTRYDKIHMFDADLGEGTTYQESESFQAGDKAVIAETPWGKIGLTICYDVRFPHLYHALAKAGASIITVPAAFTVPTGQMHWHTLLRARAIETGCFILAPAQCGFEADNRPTFGHSLIISPSGKIIAEAGEKHEIIMAELDLNEVEAARHMLPSLKHDRIFTGP